MSFGLCNAPSTFQRCMISIFLDLLEECIEVFMDNFTVYMESFDACIETNLLLNFEKCHFMVTEGIVLGHLVSSRGIEVDKAKVDIITSLPNLAFVRDVHSFLGHIALPLYKLLQKEVDFVFDKAYEDTFQELKTRLTSTPILQASNWEYPFELMCDASNSALRAVLGQQVGVGKLSHVIAYASRTMDLAQMKYTTTKKELLAIVFALDKFRSYLLGSKVIVFPDHATLKFLLKKPDAKDKKVVENSIEDHLSRIEREIDPMPIRDDFPDEQLLWIDKRASRIDRENLKSEAKYYVWDDPFLWRFCNDQIIHRCISDPEIQSVLHFYHLVVRGGHYGSTRTIQKVLECGFCWPTIFRDAHQFVSAYEPFQRTRMTIG
ncbi:Retrovirus-related Pol polyprotein, partial [Mucuna pruriens]